MQLLRPLRESLKKAVQNKKHGRFNLQIPIQPLIEIGIITLWAFWVGRAYLNFDLSVYPHGGDYSLTIQPNTIWQYLDRCGLCVLWNGFINGGFPTFAEIHSAFLHPLVVFCTLLWGTLNGAKITLILSLAMAGWAQWWLARTLNLGLVARLWSAGMAVVGGNLAGRMELGLLGLVLSTASCSLVVAAGVNLAINRRRTSIVAFAITFTLALLSGQGYMQIGLLLGIFPAFSIFILDRSLKPNSLLKQFAIAFGLALLLCGLLLIPTLHFLPNYAKETDASFSSVQPMGYSLLNLVIRDFDFFQNDSLGKIGFPAIYINYIGWPAILLALAAFWLSPPDKKKPLGFFGIAFLLVLVLSSEELILFLSNRIPRIISMIRYPPLVAGLLVPLILGMSAISVDRLLQITWPKLSIDLKKGSKLQLPLLWLVLALPLSLNLRHAYRFGQNWLVVAKIYPDIQRLGSAIPNAGSVWVQPPVDSHQWSLELIEDGHKVTNVFRPWHWKYRSFPPPSFQAFSPQDEILSGDIITMVDEIRVVEHSEAHYAAVLSQIDGVVPCSAQSIGGHINVYCSTQSPGRLIIHENSFPGWVVYRDEERVQLNRNTFLEVDAPPGEHTYNFRYRPFDVLIGACLTFAGIALSIRMLLQERGYGSRSPNGTQEARRGKASKRGKLERPKQEQPDEASDSKVEKLSSLTQRISSLDLQWIPLSTLSLGQSLLYLSIGLYIFTRFIGITDFPIAFSSDEASHTVLASELIREGFVGNNGHFLPTYFEHAGFHNLSLSVYLQIIPYLIFGKSIFAARAISVLVSLSAAYGISLLLRLGFTIRHSWIGFLVLSIAPAWFLHSRFAFETTLFASLIVWMVYYYFRYRLDNTRFLNLAVVFAFLAFYSYRGGQIIIVAIALLLIINDWSYHRKNIPTISKGILVALLFSIPYLRHLFIQKGPLKFQLFGMGSSLFSAIPVGELISLFFNKYWHGLNPGYWFLPDVVESPGQIMKGYGHILLPFLPIYLLGLFILFRNIRRPEFRVIWIIMLASPLAGAIGEEGITSVLVFLIPATIAISLGLQRMIEALDNIWDLDSSALSLFALMIVFHISMTGDALINGPTWPDDYGLTGFEYGAKQVFTNAEELVNRPDVERVYISPTWAKGTDILWRFFITDVSEITMANASGVLESSQPELMDVIYYVVTTPEYIELVNDPEITRVEIERVLEYPNGKPGFFFIRVVDASDKEQSYINKQNVHITPQEVLVEYHRRKIDVKYSKTDMCQTIDVFDDDPLTLNRLNNANSAPLTLKMDIPIDLNGIAISTGRMEPNITFRIHPPDDARAQEITKYFKVLPEETRVELVFEHTIPRVAQLEIEIMALPAGEGSKIHLRELAFL